MLRYDFRFYDRAEKRMIYAVGISPTQLPIVQREDLSLEMLKGVKGRFVPMINTGQRATNGFIWEADIVECDVPLILGENMPVTYAKMLGVMQYNQDTGGFTVNIAYMPESAGEEFKVVNSRIVGNVFEHPQLLKNNEQDHTAESLATKEPRGKKDGGERA